MLENISWRKILTKIVSKAYLFIFQGPLPKDTPIRRPQTPPVTPPLPEEEKLEENLLSPIVEDSKPEAGKGNSLNYWYCNNYSTLSTFTINKCSRSQCLEKVSFRWIFSLYRCHLYRSHLYFGKYRVLLVALSRRRHCRRWDIFEYGVRHMSWLSVHLMLGHPSFQRIACISCESFIYLYFSINSSRQIHTDSQDNLSIVHLDISICIKTNFYIIFRTNRREHRNTYQRGANGD